MIKEDILASTCTNEPNSLHICIHAHTHTGGGHYSPKILLSGRTLFLSALCPTYSLLYASHIFLFVFLCLFVSVSLIHAYMYTHTHMHACTHTCTDAQILVFQFLDSNKPSSQAGTYVYKGPPTWPPACVYTCAHTHTLRHLHTNTLHAADP